MIRLPMNSPGEPVGVARPSWLAATATFLIGIVVLVGATADQGSSKEFLVGADASQYSTIAQSLAQGRGYKCPVCPWRDSAEHGRMPGWPVILAAPMWAAPRASVAAVSRFTNAFCLALTGLFVSILVQCLGVSPLLSIPAGLTVSLSPTLVYLSLEGLSEPSFVMVLMIGLAAALSGRRWFFVGALVLGLAPLIRSNFVLVPPVFSTLLLLVYAARRSSLTRCRLGRWALACVLAVAPSLSWLIRNHSITGRFFFSSIEGETLYGANNDVVANDLQHWGYWVMPDAIPGETPKLQLIWRYSDPLALNDYYHHKAVTWIEGHLFAMPRLVLGKIVRTFSPVPWVPSTAGFAAFSCRFLFYFVCLLLLPFWWRGMDRGYLLFVLAVSIVHLMTTAIYYGAARFTHCFVDTLLVPCVFYGLQQLLSRSQTSASV